MEEDEPCEFCGSPVQFFDDDWMMCAECGAEYSNMDYTCDAPVVDLTDSQSLFGSLSQ